MIKKIFLITLIFCITNTNKAKPMKKAIAMAMLENFDKNQNNSLKEALSSIKKKMPSIIKYYDILELSKKFDINAYELAKELENIIPQANEFILKKDN